MRGIAWEPDVFMALESLRGNQQNFRSRFVNDCVREKLNLPRGEK
jgi:hypothetical protein